MSKRKRRKSKPLLSEAEKQRMFEDSRRIRFIARQINASVPEELRESRKNLNDVQIVLCSQVEEIIKYPSKFKLMMDRIYRTRIELKKREDIRERYYGSN